MGAIEYLEQSLHRRPGTPSAPFNWPRLFAAAFALEWLVLAWRPRHLQDWALENVLTLLAAWWLVRAHRVGPLSNLSYALLLIFGSAHAVGAHYTYAEVPYRTWLDGLFGGQLPGWAASTARNQYDRLVHFLFGLLCYRPMREALRRALPFNELSAYLLTGTVLVTISTLYELLEWQIAIIFGGDLGQAYLGTQGDNWDAQKDMAVALLGTCLAALVPTLRHIEAANRFRLSPRR